MSDIRVEKTKSMLALQDTMNKQVDPEWRSFNREWYRAIWIECAELMDHYGGWKWWKHSTPDFPQVVLEIVDIWHFGLSLRLQTGLDDDTLARAIVDEWQSAPPAAGFLPEVERLAARALREQDFAVGAVANLLHACDRDFDDMYRSYVAKNVLNLFRQEHGYKSGEYVKVWSGREDNEVLVELVDSLDSDDVRFPDHIRGGLEQRYEEVLAQRA